MSSQVLIMSELKNCDITTFLFKTVHHWILPASFPASHTFQGEDPVSQSVHNVIERSFIRHVEEEFVVRIAGDVLDLVNERLRVLLPADIMTQNLETSVGGKGRERL